MTKTLKEIKAQIKRLAEDTDSQAYDMDGLTSDGYIDDPVGRAEWLCDEVDTGMKFDRFIHEFAKYVNYLDSIELDPLTYETVVQRLLNCMDSAVKTYRK